MTGSGRPPPLDGVEAVLVTGAGGFVGRHMCEALERLGKRVVRASSRSAFDPLRDPLPLDGIGHIFHIAARTGVPAAWADPAGYVDVNTLGTVRVLEQARAHRCGVTFLSAYVYGVPRALPIREDAPAEANNPYALSKRMAEEACAFYARAHGLSVSTLRLFNLYGPGQDDRFLVPLIARQALDPTCREIEVADLQPSRDYVFVDDAIEAIIRTSAAPPGSVFNVGSGVAHSVEEVIRLILVAAGVSKPYRGRAERRSNEIDSTVADITAIRRAVGWRPAVTLGEGLRRVIGEMRAQ